MFNQRNRIIKRKDEKITDLEEEVAKSLHQLESQHKNQKDHIKLIFINSVSVVDYKTEAGEAAQYLLIRILHRSFEAYRKVGALVLEHLETQYEKPVMVVANRTIISPSGK